MRATRDLMRRRLLFVRPNALALLTSVPGIGKVPALTILYEIHDISRFPSVRDFTSYSRLVKCERRHHRASTLA